MLRRGARCVCDAACSRSFARSGQAPDRSAAADALPFGSRATAPHTDFELRRLSQGPGDAAVTRPTTRRVVVAPSVSGRPDRRVCNSKGAAFEWHSAPPVFVVLSDSSEGLGGSRLGARRPGRSARRCGPLRRPPTRSPPGFPRSPCPTNAVLLATRLRHVPVVDAARAASMGWQRASFAGDDPSPSDRPDGSRLSGMLPKQSRPSSVICLWRQCAA